MSGTPVLAEQVLSDSKPMVRERGPHHQRVEYISTVQDDGRVSRRTNSYVVLGTGMNRWDDAKKEWTPASDKIEMVKGRGVVRNAQHRLILASNTLSRGGLVDLETPGGERIVLQPLGLAVTDATGRSVFLAEVKDSSGELVGPNEMLYRDAFDLVHGHISIKVSLDGVESDVILAERFEPELLRKLGIDPETARLEMWHEVLRKPKFNRSVRALHRRSGRRELDHTVEFGGMAISAGTAFKLDRGARPATSEGMPVAKEFIEVDGADFLIESVPFVDAASEMGDLPPAVGVALVDPTQLKAAWGRDTIASGRRARPISLAGFAPEFSGEKYLAARSRSTKALDGFVIDYPITLTTQMDFTFRGDTTYYITNKVFLFGTTRLEGGAVIKTVPYHSAVQAALRIYGSFECLTSPLNPAIFTARDDDTVGERIAESAGVVATNIWYSHYNLHFAGTVPVDVHDIQTRHGHVGVFFSGPGPHQARNVQVFRCYRGIEVVGSTVHLRNALLYQTRYAIHPPWDNGIVHAEHLTIDNSQFLFGSGAFGTLYLTNSLLCNVGNSSAANIFKERVETVVPSAFQAAGRGLHYLSAGSPHRNSGSENINAETSALLLATTTHPPTVLEGDFITDTTLTQSVARDVDLPDLGFHYFPLDYCAGGVAVDGATLTLGPGVNIGAFGAQAFVLDKGGSLVSAGRVLQRNVIVSYNAVQSESTEWGGALQGLIRLGTDPGRIELRHTDAALLANTPERRALLSGFFDDSGGQAELSLSDSRLVNFFQPFRASRPSAIRFANNVFERCVFVFEQGLFRGGSYAPLTLDLHNNLFHRGTFYFVARAGSTPWLVRDNFFNSDVLSASGFNLNFAPNFNAFRPGLGAIGGPNNQVSIELLFRAGPLGPFYFADSGSITNLLDAGSRPAGEAHLYHATTSISPLTREENSIVDIGFHYAGVDPSGDFLDSDQDLIVDVDEDRNGNGLVDAGETNHSDRDSDFDGVFDGLELSLGHDPLSEKSLEWKSLSSFRFDDGNFVSVEGSAPILLQNLVFTNGYRALGADFSSTSGPVVLKYPGLEANGRANISLAQGSIRLRMRTYWFSKDPILDISETLTYGGLGPREWVTLVETTNLSVRIDPDGLKIFVLSRATPGQWTTNLQASILVESIEPRVTHAAPGFSWWYDLLITYSAEETRLNWIAPGPGVVGPGIPRWQGSSTDNQFLSIGSAADGSGRINSVLDDIVIYNVPGVMHTNPWTFSAIASTDPARLNLVWPGKTNLLLDLLRRNWGETNWQWLPGAIGTNFVDDTVVPGERYEYNLNAGFLHFTGVHEPYGHTMTASVLGSAIENRGKVILLVDETLASALQPDLDAFHADLVGDGWSVIRANMPRHVDDYSSTERFATNWFNITNRIAPFIRSNYTVFSSQIKHVLLLGHVTIPHLGDQADDGHWTPPSPFNPYGSHQGTWASDLYYSDIDGIWNDVKMVDWSAFPENRNSPADGKLDDDYLPPNANGIAQAEMTVARIDFARLPAFTQTETELLRRYLQKNHRFRHKELTFEPNAVGADLFFGPQSVTHPEHMARQMASKLGVMNLGVIGDVFTAPGSFVLGAQSGSGFVDRINAVRPQEQTTEHFATNRIRPECAFYLLRGSFFQDWNLENNFMRAILTPDNGGLAAGWFLTMGVWRLDPLASGLELGSLWREAVNTRLKYLWGGQSARATQILGDSTLRYPVLAPASAVSAVRAGSTVDLSWTASPEPGCAYNVYRSFLGINSPFVRVNAFPITGTTFSDSVSVRASPTYMIRAVKVTETGSGSFTNLSQGVFKGL